MRVNFDGDRQMDNNFYDFIILGWGPGGLFAGFYAGMRQAKTKIIESLPNLGGQLSLLYPEKLIYDVAGFPNIKAQDLVNNLTKQIEPFNHSICLQETVLSFDQEDNIFKIQTDKELHFSNLFGIIF